MTFRDAAVYAVGQNDGNMSKFFTGGGEDNELCHVKQLFFDCENMQI